MLESHLPFRSRAYPRSPVNMPVTGPGAAAQLQAAIVDVAQMPGKSMFPSGGGGGHLVAGDAPGPGHTVKGGGGGHAAGHPLHAAPPEVGDGLRRVRRNNGHAVAGGHEELLSCAQGNTAVTALLPTLPL